MGQLANPFRFTWRVAVNMVCRPVPAYAFVILSINLSTPLKSLLECSYSFPCSVCILKLWAALDLCPVTSWPKFYCFAALCPWLCPYVPLTLKILEPPAIGWPCLFYENTCSKICDVCSHRTRSNMPNSVKIKRTSFTIRRLFDLFYV